MTLIVPPEGSLTAPIVLVGEAPGETETKLVRPFVGASGQLLDTMLHAAGIPRGNCYLTNVIKERPANNDIRIFLEIKGSGKVIEKPGYKEWETKLHDELQGTTANVFIAVGATALYALTGQTLISKRRGSVYPTKFLVGGRQVKVVATLHPAFALREYLLQYPIIQDLGKALREADDPSFNLPARTLRIRPSYEEALTYLREAHKQPDVGFDIEVLNEELGCFAVSKTPTDCMCIPLVANGTEYFDPDQERAVLHELARLLANPRVTKVGQNIIFDLTFLYRKYQMVATTYEDTMIAQAIAYPDFPKGLDFICATYTNENYYKDEGKKHFKVGGSDDDFWLYNAKDSAVCQEALPKIKTALARTKNMLTYRAALSLIEPLIYAQERGIRMDYAGMMSASVEAKAKIEKLVQLLWKQTGEELNPASPKQLRTYFYVTKNLKPYVDRKTGKPTTDGDAMKRIARKGFPEAKTILDIREQQKLNGTYLEMDLDTDHRLRTSFNPVGTDQGRISSSKTIFGTGANMQNIPHDFKRFMLADVGCVLYNIDLAQAENRIVAYAAPDQNMIRAFEKNIDLHKQTASLIFDCKLEEVSDEPGSTSLGGGKQSQRFWGKKANHGLNYGLGYKTFAMFYELPEMEAKFICDRYHQAYPGVRRWQAKIVDQLKKNRTLSNLLGRNRVFLDRWGEPLFGTAYSFTAQSTVADIINRRGVLFLYHDPDYSKVEFLNQVHDSIVVQISLDVPLSYHCHILRKLKTSLEQPLQTNGFTFSIPADVAVGVDLHDMVTVSNFSKNINLLEPEKLRRAILASVYIPMFNKLFRFREAAHGAS